MERLLGCDIRMRGIFDLACFDEFLILRTQHRKHLLPTDKRRRRQWSILQHLPRPIIVQDRLSPALGHFYCHQSRDLGRVFAIIHCRIDMPTVEPRKLPILVAGDRIAVKVSVMRMSQLHVLEALVGLHEAVPFDLDLGLVGDGLEMSGQGLVGGFVVAVLVCSWVEAFGEFVLGFRGEVLLVFEED